MDGKHAMLQLTQYRHKVEGRHVSEAGQECRMLLQLISMDNLEIAAKQFLGSNEAIKGHSS